PLLRSRWAARQHVGDPGVAVDRRDFLPGPGPDPAGACPGTPVRAFGGRCAHGECAGASFAGPQQGRGSGTNEPDPGRGDGPTTAPTQTHQAQSCGAATTSGRQEAA